MQIRKYQEIDLPEMTAIWNEVVKDGIAFPQEECLTEETGENFFGSQSYTGVAEIDGKIVGLYILHPNNVGRCGHICNASYAVSSACRGQHIGEKLVLNCLKVLYPFRFFLRLFTIWAPARLTGQFFSAVNTAKR